MGEPRELRGFTVHRRKPLLEPLLRKPVRNPNLLHIGIQTAVFALLLLVVNIVSSSGLEWVGWALFAVMAGLSAVYVASWYRVVLDVRDGGVRVRNLFRDGFIDWREIDRFSITAPERRTPLHLAFSPWADAARVRCRDGSSRRIRAVQPWHGFTKLVYFDLILPTDADDIVAALNHRVEQARRATSERGRPGSG